MYCNCSVLWRASLSVSVSLSCPGIVLVHTRFLCLSLGEGGSSARTSLFLVYILYVSTSCRYICRSACDVVISVLSPGGSGSASGAKQNKTKQNAPRESCGNQRLLEQPHQTLVCGDPFQTHCFKVHDSSVLFRALFLPPSPPPPRHQQRIRHGTIFWNINILCTCVLPDELELLLPIRMILAARVACIPPPVQFVGGGANLDPCAHHACFVFTPPPAYIGTYTRRYLLVGAYVPAKSSTELNLTPTPPLHPPLLPAAALACSL